MSVSWAARMRKSTPTADKAATDGTGPRSPAASNAVPSPSKPAAASAPGTSVLTDETHRNRNVVYSPAIGGVLRSFSGPRPLPPPSSFHSSSSSSSLPSSSSSPSSTLTLTARGLWNSHNRCYRNAVLQSLCGIDAFAAVFDQIATVAFPSHDSSFLKAYASFHKEMGMSAAAESGAEPEPQEPPLGLGRSNSARMSGEPARTRAKGVVTACSPEKLSKSSRRRARRRKMMMEKKKQQQQVKEPSKGKDVLAVDKAQTQTQDQDQDQGSGQGEAKRATVSTTPLDPRMLDPLLDAFQRDCKGRQEDAQEFYHYLVEALHGEMLVLLEEGRRRRERSDAKSGTATKAQGGEPGWSEVGKKSKGTMIVRNEITLSETPISRVFGGSLRLELNRRGMKNTVSTQPFYELQLDIDLDDVRSISEAMRVFMSPGHIEGLRAKGGKKIDASQHSSIRPPKALVLHLKRFNLGEMNGHTRARKVEKVILYEEMITLPRRFLIGAYASSEFHLKAVVSHIGNSITNGHYTAYVKKYDRWYLFNDTKVSPASTEEVLSQNKTAYLLFYESK